MGLSFRKRNPNGLNVSLSSRGLRISKTIKMGKVSYNIGRYFGGTHNGKTTGVLTARDGGLEYRKQHTLFKNKRSVENTEQGSFDSTNPFLVDLFLALSSIIVVVSMMSANLYVMLSFPEYKEFVNSIQLYHDIVFFSVMFGICAYFIKLRFVSDRAITIYKSLILPVLFEFLVVFAAFVHIFTQIA